MNKTLVFAMLLLAACHGKEHKSASVKWKELDSFHDVMAAVFHPLKDSGSLAPAKRLAHQLAQEADRWASSPLPDKVNNQEMKSNLEKLKAEANSLAEDIDKGAPDDDLKVKVTALHEQFHKIMEAWQGDQETEEHEHHHE